MNTYELEDALVEFIAQNTSILVRFRYDEVDKGVKAPNVYSGFVPRNEVGEVDPGGFKRYPGVIVNAKTGISNPESPWDSELVTVSIVVGTLDFDKDQQGYRDVQLLTCLIKDRLQEESIIRERFPIKMPIKWEINKKYTSGQNSYPFYFGDIVALFEMPVMTSQYAPNAYTGDYLRGIYNERTRPDTTERPTPYGE